VWRKGGTKLGLLHLATAEGRKKDNSRPPFSAPRRWFFCATLTLVWRCLVVMMLLGCGARTELRTLADEGGIVFNDDAGTESCGDASCTVSTEFCYHVGGGPPPGTYTSTCKPFPPHCHDCSCANPPQQNLVCVCSGDVGYINVSCSFP
jgi:hypothetical protein